MAYHRKSGRFTAQTMNVPSWTQDCGRLKWNSIFKLGGAFRSNTDSKEGQVSLTSTISILEVAWTAVCLPGLYYAFRLFVRALGDLGILRRSRINSIREYAAITTIILFGSHALVQFVFVQIGRASCR